MKNEKMMKAVIKHTKGPGLLYTDVKKPKISHPKDVLVKVLSVSLCGTDMSIYEYNDWAARTIPDQNITGHEGKYKVVEIGTDVTNVSVGDIVVAESHLFCGECRSCYTNAKRMCDNSKGILGVTTSGVWSEYAVLPSNLLININGIDPIVAGILEPLGNAVHTVSYTNMLAKHILVTGGGPIGIMAALIAQISGAASVTIMELQEYRIEMAKSVGITNIINPLKEDPEKRMREITSGVNFDAVMEITGSHNALNAAINLVAKNGEINILSVYHSDPIVVNMNTAVFKNLKLQTLNGRRLLSTWYTSLRIVRNNLIPVEKLKQIITHTFYLKDFEKGFELAKTGKCGKISFLVNE